MPNPSAAAKAASLPLRRRAASLGVAGTHQATGHRPGMRAALEDRRPRDQRRLVAVDPLHEAAAAGGHVVDELGLVEPQALEIDQVHVGAQTRLEPAAIAEAEEIRGLAGLPLDQELKRQARPAPPVASPM